MATLEERVSREEGRSEQFDKRLEDLGAEMRSGFDRLDRTIEVGFERTDRAIDGLRKLLVGLLIAIISGLATIVVLLLIVIINLLN